MLNVGYKTKPLHQHVVSLGTQAIGWQESLGRVEFTWFLDLLATSEYCSHWVNIVCLYLFLQNHDVCFLTKMRQVGKQHPWRLIVVSYLMRVSSCYSFIHIYIYIILHIYIYVYILCIICCLLDVLLLPVKGI